MSNYSQSFISVSEEIIKEHGRDTVKRWAQSSDPAGEMFKKALEAARAIK